MKGTLIPVVVVAATVAVVLLPREAAAQRVGATDRPVGFALEFDLGAASPVYVSEGLGALGGMGWSMAPELALGAQIRRFFIGLQTAITFWGVRTPDADDYHNSAWAVRIGPEVDGEVWTSRWAALYVGGGIGALIYRTENEDFSASGFTVDLKFGGRVWILPQLALGLHLGTSIDAVFSELDGPAADVEQRTVAWNLYGAFSLRFVAAR